jgi:hypothetical protein
MPLGINDASLVIPGRGTLFVAPKNTPLGAGGIAAFADINQESVEAGDATFLNFGHTSSENLFSLTPDGGDATSLRTWLRENMKTIYDDMSWALAGKSVQFDAATLQWIFNGWSDSNGKGTVVGAAKKATEAALVLIANAGDGALGFYLPNVSIAFDDDGWAPDLQQFAEMGFIGTLQAAASTALPTSPDGRSGLFAIYGPEDFSAPTVTSVTITTADGASSGRPSSVAVGASVQVAAEITFSDGTKASKLTDDSRLTWASSDETKATIADGTITGVAVGSADITVAAGGKTSTALSIEVTSA